MKKKMTSSNKRKGGGWFTTNKIADSAECNQSNLDNLNTEIDLRKNYQKCCPKSRFGFKNSSPYCKSIYSKHYRVAREPLHLKTDEDVTKYEFELPKSKWWFWGGNRQTKKRNKKHKSIKNKRITNAQ